MMKYRFNTFFKDKEGRAVLWQFPNAFLGGWIFCRIGNLFLNGDARQIVGSLGTILLAVWAILEIANGASYFRRALGCLVLIAILGSIIFS